MPNFQASSLGAASVSLNGATVTASTVPRTRAASSVLEASHVLKASAGTFYSASVEVDSSLATNTYYILVIDASSLPSNGAVTVIRSIGFEHINGTRDYVSFDQDIEAGTSFASGCVVALSTTRATLTVGGAYLWIEGTVS